MNILVLGNGFDLALGLPTRYTDFLAFVRDVRGFFSSNLIMRSLGEGGGITNFLENFFTATFIEKRVRKYLLNTQRLEMCGGRFIRRIWTLLPSLMILDFASTGICGLNISFSNMTTSK